MELLALVVGVIFLLVLIIRFKINTFVSLVMTSVLTALLLGMNLTKIMATIEEGIGSQLGELSLVFGFGAMLGRLVADAGGAYVIATTLIDKFGKKRLQVAIMLASFIIGIALFFEVGLVLLIPIVFAIAVEADVPILYLGISMAAALSVTHGFLPPHPAPVAIAAVLNANDGEILLLGLVVAIPSAIVAGPLFTKLAQRFAPSAFQQKGNLSSLGEVKTFKKSESPSFGMAVLTSLFPVILMAITTIYKMTVNGGATPTKGATMLDQIIHRPDWRSGDGHADFAVSGDVHHGLGPQTANVRHHAKSRRCYQVDCHAAFGHRRWWRLQASLNQRWCRGRSGEDLRQFQYVAFTLRLVGRRGLTGSLRLCDRRGLDRRRHRGPSDGPSRRGPRFDGARHWGRVISRFARERRRFLDVQGILRPLRQTDVKYLDGPGKYHFRGRHHYRAVAEPSYPLTCQ